MRIVENEDNVCDFTQSLLDEKLVPMSVATLSESSGLTVDNVTSILGAIRDEVVDLVMIKKHNVALNLGFGVLNLRQGGTVEFKSNSSALVDETDYNVIPVSNEHAADQLSSAVKKSDKKSTFSSKRLSETVSRKSNAERNLNFM